MSRDPNPTDDAEDLFSRGHQAFTGGDYREAVECFSRAIRLRPEVSAPYRFRAYAYLELGDRVRALNDLDQAIRLKPNDVQLHADRAAELYVQKAFDQALADCERVLKLDPGRAPIYGLRGRCHADRGDTESALQDYAQAIAGDPENAPRYLLWRAQLYLECEQFSEAEADATQVITLDPANPEAHYTRGTIRQLQGQPAAAIEDYSAGLELKPEHTHARIGRAMCYLSRQNFQAVIDDCDKVIQQAPDAVKAYELRGTAQRTLGDLEAALADFNEAIRLSPAAVTPYNCRAGVHYAKGNYAAAARDHMEALKRDPRHAGTFNQLAWVWSTCPDPDVRNGVRARECATRACELTDWLDPSYLDTLAAAYAECGEFEEAVKWQEKAIENVTAPELAADYQSRLELYRQRRPARLDGTVNS